MTFWDLHSIVHIPVSDKNPIHFYHASLRDFLMDRPHTLLLRMCLQTLTDFHGGSNGKRTAVALDYTKEHWLTHYICGDQLDPGPVDKVLEEYDPEILLPFKDSSDNVVGFISWWDGFRLLRDRFHSRCSSECSDLCFRYTSVLDRYLVHRFQKHKLPPVAAALMGLTLLGPIERAPWRSGDHELIVREADWFWDGNNPKTDGCRKRGDVLDIPQVEGGDGHTLRADERPCKIAVRPGPLLLTWLHQALRAAFEPSDADLNPVREQGQGVVMVDSDDEPLKKSKAKVADSDDVPT
ncbi:uncharacterized protein LACBIDRAFT_328394 [Laccaria bicolor S238N-H82]|uniref:Predicted protein n=1 Tax=Laccaria bicolor (strain S238N-H82 / ATCC MYA-4686) TaxID=486041 RepID=B0DER3_LACBS|nr:uncharacterized protein LACBIDRAFT_328394 [Laccaria bicolor S238N-H82]EDR06986.1 predicted protein [Laccaria bicolor S238N-H82]|eukprot:XP_001882359.1 predicted protein [Laccaria bicolor S238N-H82]